LEYCASVRIAPGDREVGDAEGALETVPEIRKTLNKQTVGTTYLPPFSAFVPHSRNYDEQAGGLLLDVFPGLKPRA